MAELSNKIDFVLLVSVKMANPNGDPLNGNRPRIDYGSYGEITAECIKRKIRNRMQDLGYPIFVQSNDRSDDGFTSLSDRASALIAKKLEEKHLAEDKSDKKAKKGDKVSPEEYAAWTCETWLDVRSFGQVFAFNNKKDKEAAGVSVGVRGPISIHQAVSIDPVEVCSYQITKSVNGENKDGKEGKSSDTMGMKHMIKFGMYEIKGAINVQLATKTGFTDEDAEVVKKCLLTLFENDASSARPDGSMEVVKLYWWKHNCKEGQYSSAKVHRSVKVKLKEGIAEALSADDYDIVVDELNGIVPEVKEGI